MAIYQNRRRWFRTALIALIFGVAMVITAIVVSLIPLYIPAKLATAQLVSSPLFVLSYNISADTLSLTLPISQLPATTLLFLQEIFQKNLDADSETAGSIIIVVSGSLAHPSSRRKKRLTSTNSSIYLNIFAYVKYPPKYNTKTLQNVFLKRLTSTVLVQLDIDYTEFQQTVVDGLHITTTVTDTEATSTTITISAAMVSGSASTTTDTTTATASTSTSTDTTTATASTSTSTDTTTATGSTTTNTDTTTATATDSTSTITDTTTTTAMGSSSTVTDTTSTTVAGSTSTTTSTTSTTVTASTSTVIAATTTTATDTTTTMAG